MKVTRILIENHLQLCSKQFEPSLDTYVNLTDYAKKIHEHAIIFPRFDGNGRLIGLIAAYDNIELKSCWITNVSVMPEFYRQGIARALLFECEVYFKNKNYTSIYLEVFKKNSKAISLYEKSKYIEDSTNTDKIILKKLL